MSFLTSNAAKIFEALSSGVEGVGQLINAREEVEVGNFNARISEQRAQSERSSQDLLEIQKRKVIKKQVGTQIALFGKSGIRFTGSVLDVITDSLANAELDIAIDRFNSEITARGFETQAELDRFQAQQRARKSRVKASTSFLSSALSLAETIPKRETLGLKERPLGVSGPLRKSGRF